MNRLQILQFLAQKINAKNYLEIGVEEGFVFKNLNIPNKIGVDPSTTSAASIFLPSNDFFAINNDKFDLIFIDGLHHADQVELDIYNSLDVLNIDGYIVCHDMLPPNEPCQIVPRIQSEWTGDCWKAWVKIRSQRTDLKMFVIDTDYGCGIIKRGNQNLITIDCDLTYENLLNNKQQWMNIISVNEFINFINRGTL